MSRENALVREPAPPGAQVHHWEWQLQGACREADPTLFFHPDGERDPARTNRDAAAVEVCLSCPVLALCREHALTAREPYGVWGGMTEAERETELYGPNTRRNH